MPNQEAAATLRAVFTFYSDIVTVSAEGDSVLSDDTLQSIGTTFKSLILALFGSIVRIASPLDQDHDQNSKLSPSRAQSPATSDSLATSDERLQQAPTEHLNSIAQLDGRSYDDVTMDTISSQRQATVRAAAQALRGPKSSSTSPTTVKSSKRGTEIESELNEEAIGEESLLIKYLPDPGYFVAGAVAGGISRTATAPLDRLKVYLLVNTKSTSQAAIDAAKNGRPLSAFTNAGRSFWLACTDLYSNGGLRGFFAGNKPHFGFYAP